MVNFGFFVGMYVRRKWEGYGKQIFYMFITLHCFENWVCFQVEIDRV